MVAKSYQSLTQVGEPYSLNHKMYVKVLTNAGSEKQVRWYTEAEYHRMYPNEDNISMTSQREALGFQKGYITIFRGNTYEDRDWFKQSTARYTRFWGWYFVSTEEVPEDLPEDVEPIKLYWEQVGNANGTLRDENQLKTVIESIIYPASPSEYVGSIGDRITVKLHIDRVATTDGYYGITNIHSMHDEEGNVYVWATGTCELEPQTWYTITGTVKEHKTYRNTKQTWLTRCKAIQEK